MKGSAELLEMFMQGVSKRFVIPVYQRNYDWKEEQCKRLYDDLIKLVRTKGKTHFFGSIVSVYNPDGEHHEYLVIDGQQRLTTVSLMLLAIHDLIEQGKVTPKDAMLSGRIYEEYLIDKYAPKETCMKLKPVKNDMIAFSKLFGDEDGHVCGSNITINYNYFYNRIQKQEITVDELFSAFRSLQIINIELKPGDDNPQLIFESLNSTGLALSEGDKIRNFVLMGLPTALHNEYYEKYWNKIEICTGYDVSSFIRDYLTVKLTDIPNKDKVYFEFKDYCETQCNGSDIGDLLKEILTYAKRYKILLKGIGTNKAYSEALNSIGKCISRLNYLGSITTARPFFLEVLRLAEENTLTDEEVREIFETVESFLFRRLICNLPSNSLNKIFSTLHKDIINFDGTAENYVEKFKKVLLLKKESSRFPDDDEFKKNLSEVEFYNLRRNQSKIYAFERFNNHGTDETADIYGLFEQNACSIEHIMPRTLTAEWKKALGEDFENIHAAWVNRLANLTIIGSKYNSKFSNSLFIEKRNMKNGFSDSGFRINNSIAAKYKWTLDELEERDAYLTEQALKIWRMPKSSFTPSAKQFDTYCLVEDDDDRLTGRQIAKFEFMGDEYPAKNWRDMFKQVLTILHSEEKSVLYGLAASDDGDLAKYVSTTGNGLRDPLEIGNGVFLEANMSVSYMVTVLRKFLAAYDVEQTELTFCLRDKKKSADGAADDDEE